MGDLGDACSSREISEHDGPHASSEKESGVEVESLWVNQVIFIEFEFN
jgi:hypothetical protein